MRSAGLTVNVLSAQKVAHIGFNLAEVFVTCYHRELLQGLDVILSEGKLGLSDESVHDLDSIDHRRWIEPRQVPAYQTTKWDFLRFGRVLDFAGAGAKVGL